MKKIYIAVLFSTLLLVSCNKVDQPLVEDVPTIPNDLLGDELRIDSGYMGCIFDKDTQSAKEFDCKNLGEVGTSNTTTARVELLPSSKTDLKNVYLKFTEFGEDLNITKKEFETFDGNIDYFVLQIYYLDKENIFVWERTGGEGSSGIVVAFYRGGAWYDWDFHEAVEAYLPAEYKDGDYAVVSMAISDGDNEIKLGVRIGEGYGATVNYLMTFDSETFEFKKIEEKQKYLN